MGGCGDASPQLLSPPSPARRPHCAAHAALPDAPTTKSGEARARSARWRKGLKRLSCVPTALCASWACRWRSWRAARGRRRLLRAPSLQNRITCVHIPGHISLPRRVPGFYSYVQPLGHCGVSCIWRWSVARHPLTPGRARHPQIIKYTYIITTNSLYMQIIKIYVYSAQHV